MNTPNGLGEIITTFGDVRKYVDETGLLGSGWTRDYLAMAQLPFSIPLSWNKGVVVSRITCHKLLVDTFEQVFSQIQAQGLCPAITDFGGCFSFRPERHSAKLSTHCWGIAIDLNPNENHQGTIGNMNHFIVDIFRAAGFKYGGDWVGRTDDPMHFQFATGY